MRDKPFKYLRNLLTAILATILFAVQTPGAPVSSDTPFRLAEDIKDITATDYPVTVLPRTGQYHDINRAVLMMLIIGGVFYFILGKK